MKLGIIGVGHLAVSVLRGLLKAGWAPGDIMLSPRGQAARMAEAHGFVLAADTASLVTACDHIMLTVRPGDAVAAVNGLAWERRHLLMSACAGVTIADLAEATTPATVLRIMPITASELNASPTVVYPLVEDARPVLDALGGIIALDREDQVDVASVSAAIYGWVQALIRDGADWSAENGLDDATARQLVARTFVAAGRMIAEQDASMAELLDSLCTPGGITEAGLDHLDRANVPEAWRGACDLVLERLRGH